MASKLQIIYILVFILIVNTIGCKMNTKSFYTLPRETSRIIGGEWVYSIEEYPFMVSIEYDKQHVCGGSIITTNIILTAASCVPEAGDVSLYRVRAGTEEKEEAGSIRSVAGIIKHDKFDERGNRDYDAAVLLLAKKLIFSDRIKAIPIADIEGGHDMIRKGMILGWGDVSMTNTNLLDLNNGSLNLKTDKKDGSYRLQKKHVFIEPNLECDLVLKAPISSRQFCSTTTGMCTLDSGGPFVFKKKLYGIMSYKYGGCSTYGPSVFMKVSEIGDFLRKYTTPKDTHYY